MAERKVGTVVSWRTFSPILGVFRLMPEDGARFPDYKSGQYIALRRDDCKLTKRVMGEDGKPHYLPDLDESGHHRIGSVAHSYSISSAPFETREKGYLEFYIVLEMNDTQFPGRLTESLFRLDPSRDDKVGYVDRIAGDFTLEKRAAGFRSVLMVGTGTGLAPFAAMIKELDHQAAQGHTDGVRYTLLHANRTYEELAYHEELTDIAAAGRFDFVYVPSVSRPDPRDQADPGLGHGRGNNLLRHFFGMPLKEEEELKLAAASGGDVALAQAALDRAVKPRLPQTLTERELRERLDPPQTVLLTCGNPSSMADIRTAAEANGIRFEKEDWKLVLPARS